MKTPAALALLITPVLPFTAAAAPLSDDVVAERQAAYRAWYQALPIASAPELTKHGLVATEIGRWYVPEANQAVAVDAEHFYGIGNFALTKHRKDTGERVLENIGLKGGPIIHYNAGWVDGHRLVLTHSNFPQLPMASSLETVDTRTLQPVATQSFGIRLGSLTWAVRHNGYWWACFANYNDAGTTPGFDQRWTYFAQFDDDWQMLQSWTFPPQVVATWGRSSSSGGDCGDDGLLYVTGHDAAEVYVLRLPERGVTLNYVTTIDVPFEGQAWAWDRSVAPRRVIYGISRRLKDIIAAEIPAVPAGLVAPSPAADLPKTGFAAHRGASGTHPENTIPALQEAVRLGAAMIEIDVQLTRDGVLVLVHDSTLDRTTDGEGRVDELAWSDLAKLDAGSWKGPQFTGLRIPTFAEALAVLPRDRWINLDIKGSATRSPAAARAAALALAKDNRLDHAFITGDHAEVDAARGVVPGVLTCNLERRPDPTDFVRETIERKNTFIQLRGFFDDPRFDEWIATLQAAKVRINFCCTNDMDEFTRLRAAGVDFPLVDDAHKVPADDRWVD